MPKIKEKVFPMHLKSKFGEVKIYRCVNRENWITHVVAWKAGGKRKRESFSDFVDAQTRAEEILEDYRQGRVERSETPTALFLYWRSCEEKLEGVPLMDAVDFYLAHNKKMQVQSARADEVAKQYYEAKLAKVRDAEGKVPEEHRRHIETLRSHMNRFRESFHQPLHTITVDQLNQYLAGVGSSSRTKHNHRLTLISLWNWARDRHLVPEDANTVMHKTEKFSAKGDAEPGVFEPEPFEKLLNAADPEIQPFLAIGAFAGVRSAELGRLRWESIDWDEGLIVLNKKITKKQRRRTAMIRPNLMTWLLPFKGRTGKILATTKPYLKTNKAAQDAGVEWVHNGLRHSYISYAMALERNADAVAEQCGNSPSEVQRSYKALVTESSAKKWFSIAKR
jgi:integrase